MGVNSLVLADFKQREQAVLQLIKEADFSFEEVGLFGSYARNEYKAGSDIDFCVITDNRPNRRITGSLREEAELLRADIIFVSPDYFKNSDTEFAKQLRRDYRRIL